jgi:alpha-mannosidase
MAADRDTGGMLIVSPFDGVTFKLAPAESAFDALIPRGQTVTLPAGACRVYVLAASTTDDQSATFQIGSKPVDVKIQRWGGLIGQWDSRVWKTTEIQIPPRTPPAGTPADIVALLSRPRTRTDRYGQMTEITPGFIKRDSIAWFASHHHTASGTNEAYKYSYLFGYVFEVPANAKTITLPNNERVRIMAITASHETSTVNPAQALYDKLEK